MASTPQTTTMPGEGFMSHAANSLKMNRRDKGNFLALDVEDLIETDERPFVWERASPQELQAIEERVARLAQQERLRVYACILAFLLLIAGVGMKIFLGYF